MDTDKLPGWSAQKFNSTERLADPSNISESVSAAVRSRTFWGYAKLVDTLAGAIDIQSMWAEGCACHELDLKEHRWYQTRARAVANRLHADAAGAADANAANTAQQQARQGPGATAAPSDACKLKGRRAHEYACGEYDSFVSNLLAVGREQIVAVALEVSERDRPVFFSDWEAATDMIVTQTSLRSSYWKTLPWKLAGMASSCPEEARKIARESKALYLASTSAGSVGPAGVHPVTRRFFDPESLLNKDALQICKLSPHLSMPSLVQFWANDYFDQCRRSRPPGFWGAWPASSS